MSLSRLINIVLIGALFCACGATPAADAPAQSPEQGVLAARQAAAKHDWGAFFDLLTESSRNDANSGCLSMGMMVESFAPQGDQKLKNVAAEFEKVRLGYGLNPKAGSLKFNFLDPAKPDAKPETQPDEGEEVRRLTKELKDKRRFYVDAMTALLPVMTAMPLVDGKLRGLKIEGDAATAEYVTSPKDAAEQITPLAFKKVGSSWKIEILDPKHPEKPTPASATQKN